MKRFEVTNGWYTDALPSGEYCSVLLKGKKATGVQTHFGYLEYNDVPLYVRVFGKGNKFKFAGQSTQLGKTLEWTGTFQIYNKTPCGTSPVIYNRNGELLISDCSIGSQGYRYIAYVSGDVVTGDETIYSPISKLHEWSSLGDGLVVGQGQESGCLVWDGLNHRLLEPGDVEVIRAVREGNDLAISLYHPNSGAVIFWMTMDELRALPIIDDVNVPVKPIEPTKPEPIIVKPIEPTKPITPIKKVNKMAGYGNLLVNVNPATLKSHPDNDGSFLIVASNGLNVSVDSNGVMSLKSDTGSDQKWTQGNKCMINVNTFSGYKEFFLEWFD